MQKNIIYVILGPTCTGKTSLGLELCKKMNGEIISFDSRQIYKYMDIGTGKTPTGRNYVQKKKDKCWNVDGITIWGYDLILPSQYFSAYDYAVFCHQKIKEVKRKGKNIFLIGGTGFYLGILTGRVKPSNIVPDFELRKELESLPLKELQRKLKELDENKYEKIDKSNVPRLIRAIEIIISIGKFQISPLEYPKETNFKYIGLTADREFLYKKAELWLETIWRDRSLIEEVKKLLISKFKNSHKLKGIIYKSVTSYLNGELNEEQALERCKFDLHAYIRRQQTYFKKMPDISWFDVSQDNIFQIIYNNING